MALSFLSNSPTFHSCRFVLFWSRLLQGQFVGSMATAALFTAMMDRCDPDQGGTDYTAQASVVLVASFGGAVMGGRLADGVTTAISGGAGWAAWYLMAAGLAAAGAVAMGALWPQVPAN